MITENLSTLKIHKLSNEQYMREREAGRTDESAMYLTPDDPIIPRVTEDGVLTFVNTKCVVDDDGVLTFIR